MGVFLQTEIKWRSNLFKWVSLGFLCSLLFLISCNTKVLEDNTTYIKGIDLLGKKPKIEIPFELEQGFIVVKLRMQKTFPMRFIFDTGAEHTVIFNKMYSDVLNISYEKKVPILGSDMSAAMYANIARNVIMETNNSRSVSRDVLILEEDYLRLYETLGIVVDGLLGGEFFRGLILEIDYKRKKIVLHNPDLFVPPDSKYDKIPVYIKNFKPYLNTYVAGEQDTSQLQFLIDTGASITFLAHVNSHPAIVLPEKVVPGRIGSGLGGDLMGYIGILDNIRFGRFNYDRVLTSYQDLRASIVESKEYHRHGLIGNTVLSRFHIYIDYNNSLIYLKPQKKYNEEFDYDKSGLTVFAFGPKLNNFYVKHIADKSPAQEAGLQEGDQILKFNGKKHTSLSLGKINEKLKGKEGKEIKLNIIRDNKEMEIKFRLKNMLKEKFQES